VERKNGRWAHEDHRCEVRSWGKGKNFRRDDSDRSVSKAEWCLLPGLKTKAAGQDKLRKRPEEEKTETELHCRRKGKRVREGEVSSMQGSLPLFDQPGSAAWERLGRERALRPALMPGEEGRLSCTRVLED